MAKLQYSIFNAAYLRAACINLWAARLRTFLAVLGVLVGTASVVALVSSGQLATQHVINQFKELGTDLLSLNIAPMRAHKRTVPVTTTVDMRAISVLAGASPSIRRTAPYLQRFKSLYHGGKRLPVTVLGVTESLQTIAHLSLAQGRFVSALDRYNQYCVLGAQIAEKLRSMGLLYPIGAHLRIGDHVFEVLGVLHPWPQNMLLFMNINRAVLLPLQSVRRWDARSEIQHVLFQLYHGANVRQVQDRITKVGQAALGPRHFSFRSPEQLIQNMKDQRRSLLWLLGLIGGVSLLVGGIGIMNILLVSVMERKREIGVRLAVGARPRDIQSLFLYEAITLTLIGGAAGGLLGMLIAFIIAKMAGWGFVFLWMPLLLGCGVSVLIGVFFGFYPAWKASSMHPVEALRAE